jgi:hypothetical protein
MRTTGSRVPIVGEGQYHEDTMLLCQLQNDVQLLQTVGTVIDLGGTASNQLEPCALVWNLVNVSTWKKQNGYELQNAGIVDRTGDQPLKAKIRTTFIPNFAMLLRVRSMSASSSRTGNQ